MGTKMKGMFKGFNKKISHIFVVNKEREMEIEIGCPTDVKHVGHIGFDGSAGSSNAPSWMGEFKTGPEFASSSIGRTSGSAITPWKVTKGSKTREDSTESTTEAPKKHRRKKHRKSSSSMSSTSSPTTGGGSTRDSSSKKKSKTKLRKRHAKLTNPEVAS